MRGILFMALLGLAGLTASVRSEEPASIHVSAYYYPWYGSDGRHWREGYDGIDRDDGPELGLYDSGSAEVIRQHLGWSREFGIDNWIVSWWGTDSPEDETLRESILPELTDETTFCLLYETQGILGLDPDRGIEFGDKEIGQFARDFRHFARNYFSHPNYYRIEGRPVVYLYLSRTFSGDYHQALARARAVCEAQGFSVYLVGDEVFWGTPDRERIAALDAVTSYNMHGPPQFSGASDWTDFVEESGVIFSRYRAIAEAEGVDFVPGILPGFDARGLGGDNPHYVIPRVLKPGADSVSFLKAQGELAKDHLDPELRAVAVTSFNEWHEGTQIEPSRKAGKAAGAALKRIFKRAGK